MTDFFVLFFSVFSSFYCFFGMQFGIIICFTGTSHACHMTLACIQYKVWYGHENSKNNAEKNLRQTLGPFGFCFLVVWPGRASSYSYLSSLCLIVRLFKVQYLVLHLIYLSQHTQHILRQTSSHYLRDTLLSFECVCVGCICRWR